MKVGSITHNRKPYITEKYMRKIRMLLTNVCHQHCAFCHNEGMKKDVPIFMDLQKISSFLPKLKDLSKRIILTGGEPLQYPYLRELVWELSEYGFDVTIDTAIYNLSSYYDIFHEITDIHVSFLDYTNISEFSDEIKKLKEAVPNLKIALNLPLYNEIALFKCMPQILTLCKELAIRMQLIRVFDKDMIDECKWYTRWQMALDYFGRENLQVIGATDREISLLTNEGVRIDFVDIPCMMAGPEFKDGFCLNEMDFTITPDFSVQFCRWSEETKVVLDNPNALMDDIKKAYRLSILKCPCQHLENKYEEEGLMEAAYRQHGMWPPENDGYLWKISQQIACRQLSYIGKEGYVRIFENHFAAFVGAKYALTFCSGTVALYIACKALGLTDGAKVIIPVYSYPGVITALIEAGAHIILCDIEADTGNINLKQFEELTEGDVKGVVITHLWGKTVDILQIYDLCKRKGIKIIEDGSHAYGASIHGIKVGNLGDVAFFSLQANKAIFAGEGGVLTTNSREVYEKAIMYSMLKKRIQDCVQNINYLKYDESGWGLKLKINPFGAIMADDSLKHINEVNDLRKKNIHILEELLRGNPVLDMPYSLPEENRSYYTCKLLMKDRYILQRDLLVNNLIREGLDVTSSSFRPLHYLDITKTSTLVLNKNDSFPNADYYAARVISLPIFTYEDERLTFFYGNRIREQLKNMEEMSDENSCVDGCAK